MMSLKALLISFQCDNYIVVIFLKSPYHLYTYSEIFMGKMKNIYSNSNYFK